MWHEALGLESRRVQGLRRDHGYLQQLDGEFRQLIVRRRLAALTVLAGHAVQKPSLARASFVDLSHQMGTYSSPIFNLYRQQDFSTDLRSTSPDFEPASCSRPQQPIRAHYHCLLPRRHVAAAAPEALSLQPQIALSH